MIARRNRNKEKTVRLTASVTETNMQTLEDYATFLGEELDDKHRREAIDYVVNKAAEIIGADPEFIAWNKAKASEAELKKSGTNKNKPAEVGKTAQSAAA